MPRGRHPTTASRHPRASDGASRADRWRAPRVARLGSRSDRACFRSTVAPWRFSIALSDSVVELTEVPASLSRDACVQAVTGGRQRIARSEEHTSELQSLRHLVCRLLLEKKNKRQYQLKE